MHGHRKCMMMYDKHGKNIIIYDKHGIYMIMLGNIFGYAIGNTGKRPGYFRPKIFQRSLFEARV